MKKNLGQNGRLYKEKKCLKNKRAFSWPSAKWFSQQQQQQQQKSFDAKMEITKKCGCCSLIVFERSNVFFSIMMMMIAGYEKTKIILNPTDNVSMSKMMMMKVKVQCGEIGPKIYQKKNSFFSSFSNLIVKFCCCCFWQLCQQANYDDDDDDEEILCFFRFVAFWMEISFFKKI